MANFREGELTPAPEIYRRLEKFAPLVPNLQLTDLDIDTAHEKRQGEFMREVQTIAFSRAGACTGETQRATLKRDSTVAEIIF